MARPSKQEIENMRRDAAAAKAEKPYMKSLTSTVEAPPSAGAGRGFVNPPVKKMANMDTSTRRTMNDIYPDIDTANMDKSMKELYPDSVPVGKPVKSMAKGGSASSRADGCAQRGKTRGMML